MKPDVFGSQKMDDGRHMGFYEEHKNRVSGGSSKKGFFGGLGSSSRSSAGRGGFSSSRSRFPSDPYGSPVRRSERVFRDPSSRRSEDGPGWFASLFRGSKSKSKDGPLRADRGPNGSSWKRNETATLVRMDCSMGSSGAPASNGFYRPPVTERGRWSSPFSGEGKSASKRWMPKAFVSPEARRWAFKMAVLAILTATSVALHGRVVEGLQDLAGFHLVQVKVTGTHYLSEAEVTSASGLKPGDGMFRLDLKTASEKVGRLPWVKRVLFERRLPQNILISVEERKPAALVDAGTLWGVDDEGRLLPPSTELLNEDLPVLSGVSIHPEDAGNTRTAQAFKPALEFLAFLKKEDPALYSDVSEVRAPQADDLRVTFLDGTMARFGSDAGEDELRHMASVLSDLSAKNRHASLLDFRYKDQVVVHTR